VEARSTLRDVAEAADVSVRTASRVLNDDPRVAPETRERVQSAITDLRYSPDLMARSLRGGTDATIGLVVESIDDPFFSQLVAAVETAVSADGRSVLVTSTHGDPDREKAAVNQLLQRRVAGLLLVPTAGDHGWLGDISTPIVLVDRPAGAHAIDVVRIDDQAAAYEATTHLIVRGHRDIAYVGDFPRVSTSAARLAGYRAAMDHHGLTPREDLLHADCPTAAEARAATRQMLSARTTPTAIFSATTRCSLGVVPALHEVHRTDIALVGFGDFAMADTLTPAVTVVEHSGATVGGVAAERLSERIADPTMPVTVVQVPFHLVERGSGEIRP
jgi:LacI family transcriptional regulator